MNYQTGLAESMYVVHSIAKAYVGDKENDQQDRNDPKHVKAISSLGGMVLRDGWVTGLVFADKFGGIVLVAHASSLPPAMPQIAGKVRHFPSGSTHRTRFFVIPSTSDANSGPFDGNETRRSSSCWATLTAFACETDLGRIFRANRVASSA